MKLLALAVLGTLFMSCTAETGTASDLKWETDLAAAQKLATAGNKLILVDFYTDWCGWCKKLDKDVFAKEPFRTKAAEGFVLLKINPDKSAVNRGLAQKYGATGFPTTAFLAADGEAVHKFVGYKPLDAYLEEMATALKKRAPKADKKS